VNKPYYTIQNINCKNKSSQVAVNKQVTIAPLKGGVGSEMEIDEFD